MDEEEWEEEEHLVVMELKGVIDNEFLYDCKSENCRLLVANLGLTQFALVTCQGIDTDEPVLQIGNYTFTGEFKEPVGTHVIFEELETSDAQNTKKLKYKCSTTKTLEMTRVFLVKKGEEEVPGSSSDVPVDVYEEQSDPSMDLG